MYEDTQFRILLVEDNPGDVRLVEIFLGESDLKNNEIVNERTLEGAIKALDESPFDVVLLDFNLLDSHGFETLDNLLAAHPKANVIVFTGMEDKNFGIRALQAGAQDYLVKGNFGSDFLAKTLRYAIERNRTNTRLEEAQARYKRIFSQSKDAIYISTKEGEFVEYNQATLDLFGYTEEELKGLNARQLYEDESQRDGIAATLLKDTFVQDYPVVIRCKDGSIRHCHITANLVKTESGTIEYHGIIRDITGQLEAAKLREQTAVAEEREQLKGQLLTMVSHEMRTPMNAIMGLVDLLLKDDLTDEQLDYLASVKNSSEHLLKMINDILELQKIQFDIELEEGTFDLHDLLTNLINIQYSTSKNVGIETHFVPEIPRFVSGDQKRLNQVLINLVGNSLKFTEEGSVSIHVEKIEQNEDETRLGFKVIDTGIGIPDDKLETIFDPFARVRDPNKKFYPGIGLGLSIVRKLVQLMGGDISASSELGKGSTFSFDVVLRKSDESKMPNEKKDLDTPLVDQRVLPMATKPKDGKGTNGKKHGKDGHNGHQNGIEIGGDKRYILLVEDDKMNQFVAKKHIMNNIPNIEVIIADNGKIAIDIMADKDFDLVLMDINMPVMNGYDTTKYIRTELNYSPNDLPILAMTAHASFVDDDKYKDYGMQDCIVKPFKPAVLFEKINRYLLVNA